MHGMRRRLFSTLLTLFSTTAILLSGATLGFWGYWVHGEQANLRAERTASVFVESADERQIEAISRRIDGLEGIESVRRIDPDEFMSYLEAGFPDLAGAVRGLGMDVIPQLLEVTFERSPGLNLRTQVLNFINRIPGVARVDDAARQVGSARESLNWLSRGAYALAFGLWVVLIIVAFGHFQGIQFKELQELQLLRGFGASAHWVIFPWLVEALVYGIFGALISMGVFWYGRQFVSAVFNDFFAVLGYDTFVLDNELILWGGAGMFICGFVAHMSGGVLALCRGKVA